MDPKHGETFDQILSREVGIVRGRDTSFIILNLCSSTWFLKEMLIKSLQLKNHTHTLRHKAKHMVFSFLFCQEMLSYYYDLLCRILKSPDFPNKNHHHSFWCWGPVGCLMGAFFLLQISLGPL